MAVIVGGNWNLNDLADQIRQNIDAALALRQRVALTAAKLARQSAQNIADTNPTYPAASPADRVAIAQKLLDGHAEVSAAMAAYAPVASYDVASPSPIR